MSATQRDEPQVKSQPMNTSATEATDTASESSTMDTDPSHMSRAISAALCRMALVQAKSLSVNGAYLREPTALPFGQRQD